MTVMFHLDVVVVTEPMVQTGNSISMATDRPLWDQRSLVLRKLVFGVSDQAPHKPGCTATEDG